jgi:hypothetical protein
VPKIKRNAKKLAFLSPRVGRPKGSIGKWNLLARHYFEENNINIIAMIIGELKDMRSAKERADTLLKLMPYIYPVLSAAQIELTETKKTPLLEKLSNADLIAKAQLILERTKTDEHEGTTTTTMELIDDEAGGDRTTEGSLAGTSHEDQDGAGEDQ